MPSIEINYATQVNLIIVPPFILFFVSYPAFSLRQLVYHRGVDDDDDLLQYACACVFVQVRVYLFRRDIMEHFDTSRDVVKHVKKQYSSSVPLNLIKLFRIFFSVLYLKVCVCVCSVMKEIFIFVSFFVYYHCSPLFSAFAPLSLSRLQSSALRLLLL